MATFINFTFIRKRITVKEVFHMGKRKRWGKKFKEVRDWPETNRRLVKRGEYLLDLGFVENWDQELKVMNEGKIGPPFKFPNSLIQLQAVWHGKSIPYRMIEGMTIRLVEMSQLPASNNYSTIDRRVNKLSLKLIVPEGEILRLFADGTSFQVIEGGEYLREKYGKKNRRWVQVVIWGDPKTKEPVSFEVNIVQESELASAKEQLQKLVAQGVDIEAAGGDGAFDEIDFWNWLEWKDIIPLIKPDKNAREDTESLLRNLAVKYRKKKGYRKWRKKTGYGHRWTATEGIFSAAKRIFGEQLHARSEIGLIQEAGIKFWAYQRMKRYGES